MRKIQLLPEDVAARIAAGEVVERPASVVKELVENSLDAEARQVEVETRGGGRDLVRVRDDGLGIPAQEAALAFRRHATSKLVTATDLEHIRTLGFRGEALASIASVSRITCTTRYHEEEVGTRLRLEGGKLVSQTSIGRPPGTDLEVRDLFYNVPARRKFLRTERTERKHIDAFLTRYAIAYPAVSFYVAHDGREVLSTSGNGVAKEALLSVYGLDLGASLLEISPALTAGEALRVQGFVSPTNVHRANRGYITLFINGRWVENLPLSYAIIQAYHTLLPTKRYPVAFVEVTMPPEEVDVNVHPAKTEVRFHDADQVFRAVQRSVRATVMNQAPATTAWEAPPATESTEQGQQAPGRETTRARLAALQPSGRQIRFPSSSGSTPAGSEQPSTPPPSSASAPTSAQAPARELPPLRVIGQAATMFIIAEGPEGLYLIDQHAAHERILYEQMAADLARGQVPAQPLLEPETVTVPLDDAAHLEALLPTLHALGLQVEAFGPGTFLVRTMPAPLTQLPIPDLIADVAASMDERTPVEAELEELVIRKICKRAAVKAGQVLSPEEMKRLIDDLEQTANPRTCPHGRPTILQISMSQLIRQFGRGG